MNHLRLTWHRADVRLVLVAVVVTCVLSASATPRSVSTVESAAAPATALASAAGSAESTETPLAEPNHTRGEQGSVGEEGPPAEAVREPGAIDGVGHGDVDEPIQPAFARRPFVTAGDSPDPQIVWSGSEYVVFSTNSGGQNIPMRTSVDLATWSEPVDAAPVLPAWGSPDLTWAPAAAKIGQQWVLYAAVLDRTTGVHCIAAFTSLDATGPYAPAAEPVRCSPKGMIDPFVFTHDDQPFLYWKAVGGRDQQIFGIALRPDGLGTVDRPVHLATATAGWEGGGVENPAMVRTHDRFVLFYSANWWNGSRYAIGYAVCDSPLGKCTKATGAAPWVATTEGVQGPGGQSFTLGPDGRVWMAYHAWSPTTGYSRGGERRLHVEPVVLGDALPFIDNRAPIGGVDDVVPWPGGVLLKGWVTDPDDTTPIRARITVDFATVSEPLASRPSKEAWDAFVLGGPFHGVLDAVPVPPGRHVVCLMAVDDRTGLDTVAGCREVDVSGTPIAQQTEFVRNADQTVTIRGWAIDPQTAGATTVEATIDGKTITAQADRTVPGLGQFFIGYGDDHGFELRVPVPFGSHRLCVNARPSGRAHTPIACTKVSATAPTTTTSTTSTTVTRPAR